MFIIKIEDNLLEVSRKHGPALKAGGYVNKQMGQFVHRDIEKYVPRDTGRLSKSSKVINTDSYTSINWQTDYAQYAYDGRNQIKQLNGKRGPRWMERYKHERELHVKEVVRKLVQNELNKGI